ncbi:hypothetical protein [Sphingomonas faeni]|uniref:hypothetical protein n=1 Tax=Sphingomonas faeni TaxID=185950 RepID=UPI003355E52E
MITPSPTANAQDVTATHAPGPWICEHGADDFFFVAPVDGEFDRDQRDANARLIAAAPDLFAVLVAWKDAQQATDDSVEHLERAIAEGWHNDPSGQGHIGDSNRLADAAWTKAIALRDAAIAKATAA